ncbi:MAG: hypothetical protein JRI35_08620 [Deltaproteobacteria bacterium]|nr:hypothetical protein [Deltaproteobacteria bacterium]RLB88723.1 MAG: hypothetical protein DRH50_14770 [Deltaproteobacteria bacterium]HDM75246.1 hypothetical protein [Deltaproteobacteria bacterium]
MKYDPILKENALLRNSEVSQPWIKAGFRFGDKGTHTSRTIMLKELALLLEDQEPNAPRDAYVSAIIDQNCLGKRTVSTRKLTCQRLSELYGLDPSTPLFRVLRHLWQVDENGRPLLALLTALARDPLLRVTSTTILQMPNGEELMRQKLMNALRQSVEDRLNTGTLNTTVRNISSSWTQSGHLKGRVRKIRQKVKPTPIVTAYALLLAYILGARGGGLFNTLWAKVLDTPVEELISLAIEAKRLGFLDLSQAGGVIEVSFARMLTEDERQLIHGTD